MSEVTPPTPTPPPAGQAALPRLTITQVPPQLLELPIGSKLDVLVIALADAAELKVSSRLGDIAVKLPPNAQSAFKPGDALILQLLSKGTTPKALLTNADGKPLTFTNAAGTNTSAASPGASPATVQVSSPTGQQIAPGALLSATLLRPVTLNPQQVVQIPGQVAGTPAGAAPGSVQPGPGISAAASATGNPGQSHPAAVPSQSANATPTTGVQPQVQTGLTSFPAGSTLQIRIVAVDVPTGVPQRLVPPPPSGQVSLAAGAQLTGVVSGSHGAGQTLVQTHAGPVTLPTAQPLPPGTELRFEIITLQTSASGTAQHGLMHGAQPILDGDWPAFEDALSSLRDIAPGAHQHIIQSALPRADAQLATNILFFLSALRGGDIKNWLGDGPMRILDRTRPELAARMRADMSQMARTVDDPASGEWRLMGVPFLHGSELDRIQMLVRDRDAGDDESEDDKDSTRFVVDLNLSRLGHLQIDGLVGDKNKRLDMVLRTDEPLPPRMREDIRRLFTDALDVTGLEGSVGFQAAPGKFVNIPKRSPGAAGDVMA